MGYTSDQNGIMSSPSGSLGGLAPVPNQNIFAQRVADMLQQAAAANSQGNANLQGGIDTLTNESLTTGGGYNPKISTDANLGNWQTSQGAFKPAITSLQGQQDSLNTAFNTANTGLTTLNSLYGPASNQQVAPGNTLVTGQGHPLYGLGTGPGGNGADAFTNFSNLQFNTTQGQTYGKMASDIKANADLVDSSFQTLSGVETKYGINASDYPDLNSLTKALMNKVGAGAGAVAAFADASNTLYSAIKNLIATSGFTPSDSDAMTKELNAASLNPSALQELYNTVKETATNRYNAQIAQALYYDKLGTSSSVTNAPPVTPKANDLSASSIYTVKKGDDLTKIATANGMTIAQLVALNPSLKAPTQSGATNSILPGQTIKLAPTKKGTTGFANTW